MQSNNIRHSPGGGTTFAKRRHDVSNYISPPIVWWKFHENPFSLPENGCLIVLVDGKKSKKNPKQKTTAKHIRIHLLPEGGCINEHNVLVKCKTWDSLLSFKKHLNLIYTNAPTSRNLPAKRLWICVNIRHHINLFLFDLIKMQLFINPTWPQSTVSTRRAINCQLLIIIIREVHGQCAYNASYAWDKCKQVSISSVRL